MIKWGCIPNKSLTLEYPKWIIGSDIERHFVRGCFDGDGCARLNRGKYPQMSITSASSFNSVLQQRLNDELTIESKQYCKKNKLTSSLMTNKSRSSLLWHSWMYDGATTYLSRKAKAFHV